jgi:hypothetical protein
MAAGQSVHLGRGIYATFSGAKGRSRAASASRRAEQLAIRTLVAESQFPGFTSTLRIHIRRFFFFTAWHTLRFDDRWSAECANAPVADL